MVNSHYYASKALEKTVESVAPIWIIESVITKSTSNLTSYSIASNIIDELKVRGYEIKPIKESK